MCRTRKAALSAALADKDSATTARAAKLEKYFADFASDAEANRETVLTNEREELLSYFENEFDYAAFLERYNKLESGEGAQEQREIFEYLDSLTVVPKKGKLNVKPASCAPWFSDYYGTFAEEHGVMLPELALNADQVKDTITGFLQEKGDSVVNTTLDITTSIVSAVVNVLLALVFSLYLLAQKETLIAQSRRLLRAALPKKAADRLMHLLSLANNAFSSFVSGQVTEAFILGTLCCIGMLILRLPYALPVSVIIATLSLIPIFGAWIGAATGAFLIVFQSPIKALWFLIFLLILQQVEGNLIYPKVVGKSVGLPGLWVLAAVTIGGGAFGVLGMLLGVPVLAVIYTLVQDFIRSRPEKLSE